MIGTKPEIIFLHYWGRRPAIQVATGFKAHRTNSENRKPSHRHSIECCICHFMTAWDGRRPILVSNVGSTLQAPCYLQLTRRMRRIVRKVKTSLRGCLFTAAFRIETRLEG